jgi:hypothetical protein
MIEDAYAHKLTHLHEPPGDGEILFAGLGVAAWVIVDEDYARRCAHDSGPEDFARMNNARVERAPADHDAAHHFVSRVKQEHVKLLDTS